MAETDWLKLWSDLTQANFRADDTNLPRRYQVHTEKKQERPDPLLDYLLTLVDPEMSVLEIGPGNGRWTIPLARKAARVTVVEPSAEMRSILHEKVVSAGLANVSVLSEKWETVKSSGHDLCVCAHSMYRSPDLAFFVRKMEAHAGQLCAMSIRIPPADGIMAELSGKVHDLRQDSPDAIIAFNALYTMGINVNIRVEEGIVHWENRSLEEAFARAKRHLRLENSVQYDSLIKTTLQKRLVNNEGVLRWPDGMRSALLYWNPQSVSVK
ncbi:MAG TPA: methyltransferase domain-containing protein [Dehalococcoidales bacterium]|nr:methyltransferase domain-containing protein [Dehalococcoidales bacterium]